jgi:hypothetical protein
MPRPPRHILAHVLARGRKSSGAPSNTTRTVAHHVDPAGDRERDRQLLLDEQDGDAARGDRTEIVAPA